MTDPTPLSPAAQAVLDAVLTNNLTGPERYWARVNAAAALRAAALTPPEIDLPVSMVVEWEKIQGVCLSYYAAVEWGYKQALAHIHAIATELENAQ